MRGEREDEEEKEVKTGQRRSQRGEEGFTKRKSQKRIASSLQGGKRETVEVWTEQEMERRRRRRERKTRWGSDGKRGEEERRTR